MTEQEKSNKSEEDLQHYLKEAKRYVWLTIGYLITDTFLIYLVMQNSQTMKAALFEDLLYFVPSLAFLIGNHYISKPPDKAFKFGYDRAYSVGFLASSVAVFGVGAFILIESLIKLINREIVTIGTIRLFGETIWFGWMMIVVVGYSIIPVYLLGQKKLKLSKKVNIQILHTDAKGQKADWMTSVAAIAGIIGIGFGLWWADAVAAIIIAVDILSDGVKSLKAATTEIMDRSPLNVELKEDPLVGQIERSVQEEEWISASLVRLRRTGNKITGDVLIVPKGDEGLFQKSVRLSAKIENLHWEIDSVMISAVKELPELYNKRV